MMRFFKRLVFALVTLGLGALAYALLRTEGERVLRTVTPSGPSEEPSPEPEAEEPRERPAPAVRTEPATPPAAEESVEDAAEPRICAGTTKAGKPFSRPAQPGSDYCWQHAE